MSAYTVSLAGPGPWGFRMQGGKDFNMPLTISRITPGSKAAQVNLVPGDFIVAIDGVNTDGMTHLEAQNKIKMASYNLALTMSNPAPSPSSFHSPSSSLTDISIGPGALDSALSSHKPIEVKGPGGKATIIHAQYNTPIGIYSQDAIMDVIAGQTQGKGHDAGILPVRERLVDSASPVYQAVQNPNQDYRSCCSTNMQSRSFQVLAHMTGTRDGEVPLLFHLCASNSGKEKLPFNRKKPWHRAQKHTQKYTIQRVSGAGGHHAAPKAAIPVNE
uniref:LIM domain binding 3a n=1 Tax=Takifugu rubripes TaxID=31033 RepID=A0A674MY91_TAKRU